MKSTTGPDPAGGCAAGGGVCWPHTVTVGSSACGWAGACAGAGGCAAGAVCADAEEARNIASEKGVRPLLMACAKKGSDPFFADAVTRGYIC
jgi:hypothetical protein